MRVSVRNLVTVGAALLVAVPATLNAQDRERAEMGAEELANRISSRIRDAANRHEDRRGDRGSRWEDHDGSRGVFGGDFDTEGWAEFAEGLSGWAEEVAFHWSGWAEDLADGLEDLADDLADEFSDEFSDEWSDWADHWDGDDDAWESSSDRGEVTSRSTLSQDADFTWTGSLGRGDLLEIKGINGAIIARGTTGSEVEVRAEKRARRSDPRDVTIEVLEYSGGVTICAVYPNRRGRENRCDRGDGGNQSVRNNDVEVTFYVSVPEGVDFRGATVNGDVEALGLTGDTDVSTVNGDVDVETSGMAEASTVNGSIDATIGSADLSHGLNFSTVNGSITVDVPADLNAEIDAGWLNGSLDSELPLTLRGRFSRRSAEGTLGSGGETIRLKTVNGSIRIRER